MQNTQTGRTDNVRKFKHLNAVLAADAVHAAGRDEALGEKVPATHVQRTHKEGRAARGCAHRSESKGGRVNTCALGDLRGEVCNTIAHQTI
jgi:hypothetical protein